MKLDSWNHGPSCIMCKEGDECAHIYTSERHTFKDGVFKMQYMLKSTPMICNVEECSTAALTHSIPDLGKCKKHWGMYRGGTPNENKFKLMQYQLKCGTEGCDNNVASPSQSSPFGDKCSECVSKAQDEYIFSSQIRMQLPPPAPIDELITDPYAALFGTITTTGTSASSSGTKGTMQSNAPGNSFTFSMYDDYEGVGTGIVIDPDRARKIALKEKPINLDEVYTTLAVHKESGDRIIMQDGQAYYIPGNEGAPARKVPAPPSYLTGQDAMQWCLERCERSEDGD